MKDSNQISRCIPKVRGSKALAVGFLLTCMPTQRADIYTYIYGFKFSIDEKYYEPFWQKLIS